MTLYLLNFNNYYNRIVKRYNTIDEYINNAEVLAVFENINFNPNDSLQTRQIINYNGPDPDYMVAVDEYNNIASRWYITESKRTRSQQYDLYLYRDLVSDWYDDVVNSPCFIEKAILPDSNPLIYNKEEMTFNQIKTNETLLMDETKSAWIVGYMSSKPYTDGEGNEQKITSQIKYHLPVDDSYASLSQYPYYQYSNLALAQKAAYTNAKDPIVCVWFHTATRNGIYYGEKFAFQKDNRYPDTGILGSDKYSTEFAYVALSSSWNENYQCPPNAGSSMIFENSLKTNGKLLRSSSVWDYLNDGFSDKFTNITSALNNELQAVDPQALLNQNGKTIYVQDTQKYYKVTVKLNDQSRTEILPLYNGRLWTEINTAYEYTANTIYPADPYLSYEPTWADYTGITNKPNAYSFSVNFSASVYDVTLEEVKSPALTYEVQIDNKRWHLNDAPYDMFCIPFSDTVTINNGGSYLFNSNKDLAFQTALALGRDYMGAQIIYDIQLLPYCPIREIIAEESIIDISKANYYYIKSFTNDKDYSTGTSVGVVLFGTKSNFSFNIYETITVENKKIQSQTDSWRLCSPNYNGLFEFNAALNDGVDFFNVDCTYKPYNPYIHINPNFSNLYGQDYNDVRGLVCGGEFSLPNVTDAWRTYELNNKNYQNIFDRQVQNMEVNNAVQKTQDIFNAVTGTVTGATMGALAGGNMGGAGAAIGGAIGGITSLAGGIADVSLNNMLRKEALDFTKDQFGYQLGNIKALPYSLAKTSAFTANNKIFPFLEYYTCTNTEKTALKNKIKYNGMTVMAIGTIADYINNKFEDAEYSYIKGKIIRLNNLNSNYLLSNAISNEINKGVFI